MTDRYTRSLLLLVAVAAVCCSCSSDNMKSDDPELNHLVDWMTGSFGTQMQSEQDATVHDMRLEIVRIWPERRDGYWLYAEQAAVDNLNKPYRQRVYHLQRFDDSTVTSTVYRFRNEKLYIGDWTKEYPLATLTVDSLTELQGCAVYLQAEGSNVFVGGTRGEKCLTSYMGATYATTDVRITPSEIYSLDRGWNQIGQQVWGGRGEGLHFLKLVNR